LKDVAKVAMMDTPLGWVSVQTHRENNKESGSEISQPQPTLALMPWVVLRIRRSGLDNGMGGLKGSDPLKPIKHLPLAGDQKTARRN
jgi:hypothetical protein